MQFQANIAQVKQAEKPHNLMLAVVFLLNLLMTPAVIGLKLGMWGLLIPVISSCMVISYIYLRSRSSRDWFVDVHWKLSLSNSRWLLRGYAASAALVFLAWLIAQAAQQNSMKQIIWTALTFIAILPSIAGVMVTALSSASGVSLAGKRQVPDPFAAKFPPPV